MIDFGDLDPELVLARLRDPRVVLPMYGKVMHQRSDEEAVFDPEAITVGLQNTVVGYMAEPPMRGGQTTWLALLKYRQGGASTTAQAAVYPMAAYTPGWDHVTIADTRKRADYLHGRTGYLHQRWPEELRTPTMSTREVRQLTFDPTIGGKMRTDSMEVESVGIGQSPNSVIWSEVPFAPGAARQWTTMFPALINKDRVRLVLESTPAPADEPGTEFWKDVCYDAKKGRGRWLYAFFPFWDGKLNQRPWGADDRLDNSEIRLMEQFGPKGMAEEHIAFRRFVMENDREIRKNPDLFDVFYPKDDVSCWAGKGAGVIPGHVLRRHLDCIRVPWPHGEAGGYVEYAAPRAGAVYVVGVDPTGYGIRDHAAFQVLEVWGDEWVQVATYSAPIGDPNAFEVLVREAGERYNMALVVVLVQGVGTSITSLMIAHGYPNLYYEAKGKPGKSESAKAVEQMLGHLTEALLDELVLRDDDLVDQLGSYRNDKALEETARAEALRGANPMRKRRPRHHWDKVSALIAAVFGARLLPQRVNPARTREAPAQVVRLYDDLTFDEQRKYLRQVEADRSPDPRGVRYTSVRRR